MTIPDILTASAKLPGGLNDTELDLAVMQAGVVWDEDRELVKKIYRILEEYHEEQQER